MENRDLPLVEMTLAEKRILAEKCYEMFILSYGLKYAEDRIKREKWFRDGSTSNTPLEISLETL